MTVRQTFRLEQEVLKGKLDKDSISTKFNRN